MFFFTVSGTVLSDDDSESVSREASPCSESPRPVSLGSESPNDSSIHTAVMTSTSMSACNVTMRDHAKVIKISLHFTLIERKIATTKNIFPKQF